MIKVIRLPAEGLVTFAIEEHSAVPFQVLQSVVGGNIEHLGIRKGIHMYLNDDGKGLELPNNEFATYLAQKFSGIAPWDNVVGNVILVGDEHPETGEIMTLSEVDIKFIIEEFFNCHSG
jgi:hypothetical protein